MLFVYVASHLESAHHLLAKVASLVEAHGAFLEARLLRIVLVTEVDAEPRGSGDPQRLPVFARRSAQSLPRGQIGDHRVKLPAGAATTPPPSPVMSTAPPTPPCAAGRFARARRRADRARRPTHTGRTSSWATSSITRYRSRWSRSTATRSRGAPTNTSPRGEHPQIGDDPADFTTASPYAARPGDTFSTSHVKSPLRTSSAAPAPSPRRCPGRALSPPARPARPATRLLDRSTFRQPASRGDPRKGATSNSGQIARLPAYYAVG